MTVDEARATEDQTRDQMILVRAFDARLEPSSDGRTIDALIAPYNTPAEVADPPDFRPYREAFAPGAFERQLAAPGRVRMWLNFEHEPGLRGIVGHGVELNDRSDGLRGSFRVHENPDGDKALQLVREGILTGLSLEFVAMRSRRLADGVVERVRAHIDKVSLCRFPAYDKALILAVRERPTPTPDPDEPDPDPQPKPLPDRAAGWPDGLVERMQALGIEPLRRVATTGKPWDGSPARFSDDQYRRSALFCRGDTPGSPKQDCSLPVLEPDGTLNTNALGAAAAALAGARGGVRNASAAVKAAAARKLIRYYTAAGMTPPDSLRAQAGQQ